MQVEVHKDDKPMFQGTHEGASATPTLFKNGADFKSCGASVGSVIYNNTDGSHGLITAVTETTVTATLLGGTDNLWDYGDSFSIYATATKDSVISKIYTDKRHGHKATRRSELIDGLFPEDIDLDENGGNVFGPGQPQKGYLK